MERAEPSENTRGTLQNGPPPEIPDFSLQRVIGRGSYGEVWLARSVTGSFRAIKIVRRGQFECAKDFEREFRGIQAFEPVSHTHRNLLRVLHVGRNDRAGFYFYVMELGDDIGGAPISDASTYRPKSLRVVLSQGALPASDVMRIGRDLAAGLSHLHEAGLVHRDIKPSNVMFVGGLAKLGDVGLVAQSRDEMSFVGTAGYVAPEGMGRPQADVYSLGKLLYEISTGRRPQDFPEVPTDLPCREDRLEFMRLNAIVLKACDPEPGRRYRSARELFEALSSAKPETDGAHGISWFWGVKLRWWQAALTLVLFLALVLGGTSMVRRLAGPPREGERASVPPPSGNRAIADSEKATDVVTGEETGVTAISPPSNGLEAGATNNTRTSDERSVPTKTVTTEGAGEFLRP